MEDPTIDWRARAQDLERQLACLLRREAQQPTTTITIMETIPLDYAEPGLTHAEITRRLKLLARLQHRIDYTIAELRVLDLCSFSAEARAVGEEYTDSSEDAAVGS